MTKEYYCHRCGSQLLLDSQPSGWYHEGTGWPLVDTWAYCPNGNKFAMRNGWSKHTRLLASAGPKPPPDRG